MFLLTFYQYNLFHNVLGWLNLWTFSHFEIFCFYKFTDVPAGLESDPRLVLSTLQYVWKPGWSTVEMLLTWRAPGCVGVRSGNGCRSGLLSRGTQSRIYMGGWLRCSRRRRVANIRRRGHDLPRLDWFGTEWWKQCKLQKYSCWGCEWQCMQWCFWSLSLCYVKAKIN